MVLGMCIHVSSVFHNIDREAIMNKGTLPFLAKIPYLLGNYLSQSLDPVSLIDFHIGLKWW